MFIQGYCVSRVLPPRSKKATIARKVDSENLLICVCLYIRREGFGLEHTFPTVLAMIAIVVYGFLQQSNRIQCFLFLQIKGVPTI